MNTEYCFCGKHILQNGRCEGGHTQGQRAIHEARQRAQGGGNPPPHPIGVKRNGAEPEGTLLSAALEYAAQGWPVFPCEPRGKKPLTANGFKDASTDESTIRAWWAKWPDANIGSPMGENRIVIDMDGAEADAPMMELERKHGPLSKTLEATTGRGRHLYLDPNGAKIKSSVGVLGTHLDIRGEGSYVILPCSIHANGTRYEWANEAPIATLPEAWRKLLSSPERPKADSQADGDKIPEGRRNQHLMSLAGSMRRPGMGEQAITAALLEENKLRCEPPLPKSEVRTIAASAARYEPTGSLNETVVIPGVLASEVTPQSVSWLWPNYIPLGKVTLFDGDPGISKSTISLDLVARITNEWSMPDGTDCGCPPSGAVIVSLEDGVADTIRPRLGAARATLEKVRIIPTIKGSDGIERTPTLPGDLPAIAAAIQSVNAKLLVLDPLVAVLSDKTNSDKDKDVRRAIAPLATLAEKTGVAVVCIRHLNKSGGQNAKYRGGGSIGIIGAARASFLFGEKPGEEGRYVFAPVKGNLWRGKPAALEYSVEDREGQPVIVWHGASTHNASSLLAQPDGAEESNGCADAKQFLCEELAGGPRDFKLVISEAKQAGITERTLYRAKAQLGVKSKKQGFNGGWEWAIPNTAKPPTEDRQE